MRRFGWSFHLDKNLLIVVPDPLAHCGTSFGRAKTLALCPRDHTRGHDTRGRSDAGAFLHPIQPLAHEGVAEFIRESRYFGSFLRR